ncbi:hypothetical protein AVEN_272684-1, partial [Araneus ventricosus]
MSLQLLSKTNPSSKTLYSAIFNQRKSTTSRPNLIQQQRTLHLISDTKTPNSLLMETKVRHLLCGFTSKGEERFVTAQEASSIYPAATPECLLLLIMDGSISLEPIHYRKVIVKGK